jgi:hypothetical protein
MMMMIDPTLPTPSMLEDVIRLIYYHWAAEGVAILALFWSIIKWIVPLYSRVMVYVGERRQLEGDHPLHRHAESEGEPLMESGILYPQKREEWRR